MSQNQWLLVSWVERHDDGIDVLLDYGVVHVNSLVDDKSDLTPGRITLVKSKHGHHTRRALIMKVFEHKWQVKELKLSMERQYKRLRTMLTPFSRQVDTHPQVLSSPDSSQQCIEPSGSGAVPSKTEERSSEPTTSYSFSTKKNIDHDEEECGVSTTVSNDTTSRYVECDTQTSGGKESLKQTNDQTTQTDEIKVGLSFDELPKFSFTDNSIGELKTVLLKAYNLFMKSFGNLPINFENHKLNETLESDGEPNVQEDYVDTSNESGEAHGNYDCQLVPIGLGKAKIPAQLFDDLQKNSYSYSTMTLLLLRAVFPRKVLATHGLTGKRSPAFPNKPAKKRLDPELVEDIILTVSRKFGVTRKVVRNCISAKCAEETRNYRRRMNMGPGAGDTNEAVPVFILSDESLDQSG